MSYNGKKVSIDGKEYLLVDPASIPPEQSKNVVLLRTRSAGVHVGELEARNGKEATLNNATRVWRWKGANTLSELSQKGGDMVYTRISEMVPIIHLTKVIECILCSEVAAKDLRKSRWPA